MREALFLGEFPGNMKKLVDLFHHKIDLKLIGTPIGPLYFTVLSIF